MPDSPKAFCPNFSSTSYFGRSKVNFVEQTAETGWSKIGYRLAVAIITGVILAGLLWAIWFVGMVMEFEYPYMFTLMKVRNATSISGVPISKVIKADGDDWSGGLHWHTCSYCAYNCGDSKNLISVQLEAPNKRTCYFFAYCRTTHTIVPLNDATAAHFPSLMPPGDKLESAYMLNGKTGVSGNGFGDFKVPANWFRKATEQSR